MSDSIRPNSGDAVGITIRREHFAAICAVSLIASFFLPWVHTLLASQSGFQFSQQGDKALLFWIMPVAALLALVGSLSKHEATHVLCVLAGLMPFIILGYGLYREGSAILKMLDNGAWLGFGSGLVLILVGSVRSHTPGQCS